MQSSGIMVRKFCIYVLVSPNKRDRKHFFLACSTSSTCTHHLFSCIYPSGLFIHLPYAGRIEVHNPHKLEANVLKKYFRHSKYASFQRQLNYFGWRKLNGKGKMAPCTYINDEVTPDIECLLTIKVRSSCLLCTCEMV
jgi:hypothetical protein